MRREIRFLDAIDTFSQGAPITHALALTYGYDGDLANERLWRPLIERFGVRHPLVIADGRHTSAGTSLGVHVLRAARRAGVFHPKLFLAVRDTAVLLLVGSANLTRGGLGANLELSTALTFSPSGPTASRTVLTEVLRFLSAHVRTGLTGRVDSSSLDVLDEIVKNAEIVAETVPERGRGPNLVFLHSYEQPLWDQLRALHGADPVERVVACSPFLEQESGEHDDGSLLRHALGEGLAWAPRAAEPRLVLHTAGVRPAVLPIDTLRALADQVELRTQLLSEEPRRIHGKLVAFLGKKRTTIAWGSANFTPAALRRSAADRGNVECLLALSTLGSELPEATLLRELQLDELFQTYRGSLPDPTPVMAPEAPLFAVGEVLYDPTTRLVKLSGEVFSHQVARLLLFAGTETAGVTPLAELLREGPGVFHAEVDGSSLEDIDPATGKRCLLTLDTRVVAMEESGNAIGSVVVRINVKFDDALEVYDNLLLGAEAITPDALLMPLVGVPEQRVAALARRIEAWKVARREGAGSTPRHQAALDVFFRNVRVGLDVRWRELEFHKATRFSLFRWSRVIRRALDAATSESLDNPRRVFLVARIAEHVDRVLTQLPRWTPKAKEAATAIEAKSMAASLAGVPLDGALGLLADVARETEATRARVARRLLEEVA